MKRFEYLAILPFVFMAVSLYSYADCILPHLPVLPDDTVVLSRDMAAPVFSVKSEQGKEDFGRVVRRTHFPNRPNLYTWFDSNGMVVTARRHLISENTEEVIPGLSALAREFRIDILDCEERSIGSIYEQRTDYSNGETPPQSSLLIQDIFQNTIIVVGTVSGWVERPKYSLYYNYDGEHIYFDKVAEIDSGQNRWFGEEKTIRVFSGVHPIDDRLLVMLATLLERYEVEEQSRIYWRTRVRD